MAELSYPIARHRLDNGLRVIVSEDHAVPVVAVNLWYGVGSRHEVKGRTGFAHLFEHLMFQGSRNVAANEHPAVLEEQGGSLNATTSFDRTNYFETVPSGAMNLALWLEADRMATLPEALDQQNLDNQRDVVKEERRQVMDNQPYGGAIEKILPQLFPPGHPYDHLPIGSMADLDAATLEDVRRFFMLHYAPGNAVLTMVGDVTPEDGFAAAERFFGQIPAGQNADPAIVEPLGPLADPVREDVTEAVPSDALFMSFRIPADPSAELDALDLAVSILADGGTARLYNRMTRNATLAQHISGGVQRMLSGTGFAQFVVIAADGVDLADIEDTLLEEFGKLAADGPTAEELEAAKAQFERNWLEHLGTFAGRADAIGHYATFFDDPELINRRVDGVRAVTADQIRSAAADWLAPHGRAVLTYRKAADDSGIERDEETK